MIDWTAIQIVKVLVAAGADILYVNLGRMRAIDSARNSHHVRVVNYLESIQ